jgi:hypothetical protein
MPVWSLALLPRECQDGNIASSGSVSRISLALAGQERQSALPTQPPGWRCWGPSRWEDAAAPPSALIPSVTPGNSRRRTRPRRPPPARPRPRTRDDQRRRAGGASGALPPDDLPPTALGPRRGAGLRDRLPGAGRRLRLARLPAGFGAAAFQEIDDNALHLAWVKFPRAAAHHAHARCRVPRRRPADPQRATVKRPGAAAQQPRAGRHRGERG